MLSPYAFIPSKVSKTWRVRDFLFIDTTSDAFDFCPDFPQAMEPSVKKYELFSPAARCWICRGIVFWGVQYVLPVRLVSVKNIADRTPFKVSGLSKEFLGVVSGAKYPER